MVGVKDFVSRRREVGLTESRSEEFLGNGGFFGDKEVLSRIAEEGGNFLEVIWREALKCVNAGDVFTACVVTRSVD